MSLFLFGFKDSEHNMKMLTPLGQATRVSYNIQDFYDDIRAGLCNIPEEDAKRLGIGQVDFAKVLEVKENYLQYPKNIQAWIGEQIVRGRELLKRHAVQSITSLEPLYKHTKLISQLRGAAYYGPMIQ